MGGQLADATRPASTSSGSKRECIEDSANLPPPDIIAARSSKAVGPPWSSSPRSLVISK
jgi:hypothetical protein